MPRRARFVQPGLPHHITQRGNNRQDVFISSADRQLYLHILRDHLDRHHIRVLAWCLMTNHVHLVAIPPAEDSLGLALGQAHSQYALEWNRRRQRVGHLWQNRFFSCSLDTGRLLSAIRYTERNPTRARMVSHAWEWPWSSAASHVNHDADDFLLDPAWKKWIMEARLGEWDFEGWRETLSGQPDDEAPAIRRATLVGEPLGPQGFLERLELEAGRRLRVLKRGRPSIRRSASASGQGALLE